MIILGFHIILFYKPIQLRLTEFTLFLSHWLKLTQKYIKLVTENKSEQGVDNIQFSQVKKMNIDTNISSLNQLHSEENVGSEQIQA